MRDRAVLLALTGGGSAWMLHLLAGYFLVSLGCARGWPALGATLVAVTVVCAAGALAVSVLAWRARRHTRRVGDEGEAPRLLLGVGGFLGVLFTVMIVLGGLTVAALPPCR